MKLFKSLFQRKIIVGIHGLANKPEEGLFKSWWIESIKEGLSSAGYPDARFRFESVYWADIFYERPQHPDEKNPESQFYMEEPYVRGNPEAYRGFRPRELKRRFLDFLDDALDRIFLGNNGFVDFGRIADIIIRKLYYDMHLYYNGESSLPQYRGAPAKEHIQRRLEQALRKHRRKRIMLIAHSMGTIISYDVMMQNPSLKVDTFITAGAPLGLPVIIKKNNQTAGHDPYKNRKAPVPGNITGRWINLSDLDDKVAMIYRLKEDYIPNSNGIAPDDRIVLNNYEYEGVPNHHKLYGYLRCPEAAAAVYSFLKGGGAEKRRPFLSRLFLRVGMMIRRKRVL